MDAPLSQSLDIRNESDPVCAVLQELGLPAVRISSGTAEVLNSNELFSSLINTSALPNRRLWFVEGVVRYLSPAERVDWEAALSNQTPIQIRVQLNPPNSRPVNSVMSTVRPVTQAPVDQSVVCVFILLTESYFDRLHQSWMAKGQELERNRIRAALHQEVAQQFLGAAFGCKVMADKISVLDENLGKEASDLAELVSQATQELHKLVNPPDENSKKQIASAALQGFPG
jgi:signal transduction histidine kinase